jgi:hypothetical protein
VRQHVGLSGRSRLGNSTAGLECPGPSACKTPYANEHSTIIHAANRSDLSRWLASVSRNRSFSLLCKRMLALIAWRTIDGIALGVGSGASAVLAALGAPVEVWATIE